MNPTTEQTGVARFEVKRILVPTDFSECGQRALAYAAALAEHHQASLRLIHILTIFDPALDTDPGDSPYAVALRERLKDEAQRQIEAAAQAGAAHDVEATYALRYSFAIAPAIFDEAESYDADLIVIGTHGRRGLGHLLLGSVAEEVVRRAPVSVLTVKADTPTARPIQRVLAPTDFSDHADHAVAMAKDLVARYDATLDLLHVVEPIPFPASLSMGARNVFDYVPDLRDHLETELDNLAGDEARVATHLVHGHASQAITDFATEQHSDLIVMATHGASGAERFFLGSVTERVVRAAPCPVLTLRTLARPTEDDARGQKARAEAPPS